MIESHAARMNRVGMPLHFEEPQHSRYWRLGIPA